MDDDFLYDQLTINYLLLSDGDSRFFSSIINQPGAIFSLVFVH